MTWTAGRHSSYLAPVAIAIPALYRSTVGKKAVMAVTGVFLILFIIAHMVGNLKIFFGKEELDAYAHWLRTIGAPNLHEEWFLWIQRALLSVCAILHIATAISLARRARKARPVRYQHRPKVEGEYAARTMRWGGVIILVFVVYHILDLTTGHLNPNGAHLRPGANIVADFQVERWYVTLVYTLAVLILGLHLRHGVRSALQSLGGNNERRDVLVNKASIGFAAVIVVGYLSVPFAVMTGLVK